MAGFDNGVMYADNVDFSGASPVAAKVTNDGQLLIGSTASPHIKVGTLASSATTITVTNSSGGINLDVTAPLNVAHGGTGTVSLTSHSVLVGNSTSAVTQIAVGGNGTVLAGSTGADPAFSGTISLTSLTLSTPLVPSSGGTGVANNNSYTITLGGLFSSQGQLNFQGAFPAVLNFSGSTNVTFPTSGTLATTTQVINWTEVTGTSATMAGNNGYISSNISLVTLSLPTTCAVGQQFFIQGKGSGGWRVQCNGGIQQLRIGNTGSTVATGHIDSSNQYDALVLVCVTADTLFNAISVVGSPTIT